MIHTSTYLPYSQIKNLVKAKTEFKDYLVEKDGEYYTFFVKLPLKPKSKKILVEYNRKRSKIQKRKIVKKEPSAKIKYTVFLDIDSTITKDNTEYPDARCKMVFQEMKRLGHTIILVSGRPTSKVLEAIKSTKASKNAIAENGGLIIKNGKPVDKLGDQKICKEAFSKLKKKLKSVKLAYGQKSCTEVILRKAKIETIRKYLKDSGVEAHESKRFIHLHQAGIDKGAALTKFISDNKIDYDKTMAIGDSEIDLPMIEVARYGFTLENAPKEVKEKVNKKNRLANSNFDGVLEAFCRFETRFKKFAKKKLDFEIDF